MGQLLMEFVVHKHENNFVSQQFLEENRDRLSTSCFKVLTELMKKNFMTSENSRSISSYLPIRIKDLRDMGFHIRDGWVCKEGEKKHKQWYMKDEDIIHAGQLLMSKLKKVA